MDAGRLLLVAATIEHVRAEIESPSALGRLLQAEVPPDWPPGEYDRSAQEFFRERMESDGPRADGWYVWYAVLPAPPGGLASLLGAGGFLGPPNAEGDVELGYSLSEHWRGKGYARDMVAGLVSKALSDGRVRRILAHTAAQNAASRAVLEGAGFHQAGAGADPGTIRYEIRRTAST